jgi:hypothetical protein
MPKEFFEVAFWAYYSDEGSGMGGWDRTREDQTYTAEAVHGP